MINVDTKNKKFIIYTFLIIVTLAVFWQVHRYDFITIDDDKYVTDNAYVQSDITIEGVRWAFSTTYAQYWHPVTWLSLMLDYQLYGLNADGYHVTNLVLHIVSALLLFWLFNRMTGEIWESAFVAAIFAVHPLRVESVAWVAKRRDVLCIFFSILVLCFYVYYTEKPVLKRYLIVFFSFIMALMSKPMSVTLPLIMILLDYWPLKRFNSRKGDYFLWQFREKTLFFILLGISSVITIYARYNGENPFENHFPMSIRLVHVPVNFIVYLKNIFFPFDMTVSYFFSSQIPIWQWAGAFILITIISITVVITWKTYPYCFVGWFWYTITILPVLGIIPFGSHPISDHHTYLPSTGIAIMVAWGIPLLFPNKDIRKHILFPISITVLAIVAVLTWRQCSYWKSTVELYKHASLITKNNYMLHHDLACELAAQGKYEEAIDHFNKSISIKPDCFISYYSRGFVYDRLGQYKLAIEDYNQASRLKPDYIQAYHSRGFTYFSKGDYELGCADAQKACALGNCQLLKYSKAKGYCR